MKKVTYIIPTVNRKSIVKSISSILSQDPLARIIIQQGGTAGENRNKGILSEIIANNVLGDHSEWISFLDDDDFYREGYLDELDSSYDVVVFRMLQNGVIIPKGNLLYAGNVGINFAIKTSFLSSIMIVDEVLDSNYLFDSLGHAEDWRFLEKILTHSPNIKITDNIYYECSQVNHLR